MQIVLGLGKGLQCEGGGQGKTGNRSGRTVGFLGRRAPSGVRLAAGNEGRQGETGLVCKHAVGEEKKENSRSSSHKHPQRKGFTWANDLISWGLSIFIWKVGIISEPTSYPCGG